MRTSKAKFASIVAVIALVVYGLYRFRGTDQDETSTTA